MDPHQNQVDQIFHEAAEIESAQERSKYFDAACGDDEQLRDRVGKRNRLAAEELFSEANNTTLAGILHRWSLIPAIRRQKIGTPATKVRSSRRAMSA